MTLVKQIAQLRQAVKQAWVAACELDGIPADSQFVVFSESNPKAVEYNSLMGQYLEACRKFERPSNPYEGWYDGTEDYNS